MQMESSRNYQLSYNRLASATGAAANGLVVTVPGNVNRHSLVIGSSAPVTSIATEDGIFITIQGFSGTYPSLTYESLGDLITQRLIITFGATANNALVGEVVRTPQGTIQP